MQPFATRLGQFLDYLLAVFHGTARAPIDIDFAFLDRFGNVDYPISPDIEGIVENMNRRCSVSNEVFEFVGDALRRFEIERFLLNITVDTAEWATLRAKNR